MNFAELLERILEEKKPITQLGALPMYFKKDQVYYPLLTMKVSKLGLTDHDAIIFTTGY